MKKEEWKPVPDYGGFYEVSNHGRVRSFYHYPSGYILSPIAHRFGYKCFSLHKNNKQRTIALHRLLLMCFVGKPPKSYQAAHINGNCMDNRLENLRWCSVSENQSHRAIHGTSNRGEGNGRSKISKKDVLKIRKLHKKGLSQKQISQQFPITYSTISSIVNNKRWTHV